MCGELLRPAAAPALSRPEVDRFPRDLSSGKVIVEEPVDALWGWPAPLVYVALGFPLAFLFAGISTYAAERWDALYEPQVFEGMPCRVMKPAEFDPEWVAKD